MNTEQLAQRLREVRPPLSENVVVLDSVTSTNSVARGILSALPPDVGLCDLLVVAGEQTAGRGREGRPWWSPRAGGLWATLVWSLPSTDLLPRLPLAVAVGLCEAVRAVGAVDCRLKWPNDLVVDGRKLGGILIEMAGSGSGPGCAIIGFGINTDIEREKLRELDATSLRRECAEPPDLAAFTIGAVRTLRAEFAAIDDLEGLVSRYRQRSVHSRGDRLIWRQGQEIVEGYYRGIDDAGFLELETGSGLRVVNAGEVIAR